MDLTDIFVISLMNIILYFSFGWLTWEQLQARNNKREICVLGAELWPLVWVFMALRGWYRFIDSWNRVNRGKEPQ